MGTKISPKDEDDFNKYLLELEGLLRNVNKNIEDVEVKNIKNSPNKKNLS